MRDAVGENARLARAGSGDDEQGAVDVEDGGALRLVQAGEEVFVGCDGHHSMLAGGYAEVPRTTMPFS